MVDTKSIPIIMAETAASPAAIITTNRMELK
jgi:hypothetical protein